MDPCKTPIERHSAVSREAGPELSDQASDTRPGCDKLSPRASAQTRVRIEIRSRVSSRRASLLAATIRGDAIRRRPPALTAAQKHEVRRMRDEEGRALHEIASRFKVSTRTVRRA